MFFTTWFLLSLIDWVDIFQVRKTTNETEAKIGELYMELIKENETLITLDSLYTPIVEMIDQIKEANDLGLDVKLHIIQKDDINAFAIPDNHLVLYSGLINECESPEELAGVLGHEMAHMTNNHVMKKLMTEVGLSVIVSMASGGNGTMIQETFSALTSSPINFTGPGSITVDESGILNMSCIDFDQDANNCLDWSDDDPVTYQQLWDVGILQANGVTGPDGDFDQFFSVSGSLGQADYTVNSKVGGLRGDFNNDQVVNATDIDLLSAEVVAGTNNSAFDLNSDGAVNQEDRTEWIDVINNTYVGDSDLNGVFDSGDFVKVFSAGQYEDDIAGNSTWETGDWNGDTEFDSGDFVAAFSAGGYDKGPRPVNAVPEPSGIAILIVGCLALLRARTR